MKMNDDIRIDVISSISDKHIEQVNTERAAAKARVRRRTVIFRSVSAAVACIAVLIPCIVLLLVGLGGNPPPDGGTNPPGGIIDGQVPVYQGMTVSNDSPLTGADASASSVGGISLVSFTKATSPYATWPLAAASERKKPSVEEGSKDHFGIEAGELLYYARPNEDIYITVKFDNPDDFEILSFTLNDQKYSSYMFEEGSDMENIVLKVNVGDVEGIATYTIDAIKYVEKEKIKDVRIGGDKTVRVGIYNENQPTAEIKGISVGYNSLAFTALLRDPEGLISATKGKTYAVIYDGTSYIKQEIAIGEPVEVSFEGLDTCKEYAYAVVAVFDAYDGEGYVPHLLAEGSFANDPAVTVEVTGHNESTVSFRLSRQNAISTVMRVELVNEDGETVYTLGGDATNFINVPGGKHFIRVVYSYNNGTEDVVDNSTSQTFLCSIARYPVVGEISTEFSLEDAMYFPTLGEHRLHSAVDFVPNGEDKSVYAVVGGGAVKDIYEDPMWGITVEVVDDMGYTYLYQSLSEVYVEIGDKLSCGVLIGTVGRSYGEDAEDHLHFVLYDESGRVIDPHFPPSSGED